MKVIAVTSCTKTKKDYPCTVREMFSDSTIFKARQIYLDKTYDDWFVWDEDDGFLHPDTIIEPYGDFYISSQNQHVVGNNGTQILSKDRINTGLKVLKQQYPDTSNIELHCHLASPFVKHIEKVFTNIVHIRPQKTFPDTAWRYVDATNMFLNGESREKCNSFIDERIVKEKNKETPIWFYHPEHEPFFGTSYYLWEAYKDSIPKYMLPELFSLCIGKINISHGWITNPDYLPYLKRNAKRWSISKSAPGYKHKGKARQRQGIKEELLKLGSLK